MSFVIERRRLASYFGLMLLLFGLCSLAGLGRWSAVLSQAWATGHSVSPDTNPERIFLNGFEAQNTTCDPIDPDTDNDGLLDLACLSAFTPPDPASIATPINPTVVTNFFDANQFIYSGISPIQRGMAPGVIQSYRAAVLRGKVVDAEQNPLPGVLVRVLNHPEYGYTYTRSDGLYDFVINGGGEIVVDYRKANYLRAQRRTISPWQDWQWLPQTSLVVLDSSVTTVALNATSSLQIHRASVQTDAAGTRQATIVFPAGTQATLTTRTGAVQPIYSMQFRATEYTVGEHGPDRMPASLPPSSGYTYAIELSADEAIAADAREVTFNQPIALYFENYRNFPVGAHIPVGYYDFRLGSWLPSDDGRVIQILGNSGGFANLDLDGSGHAADAATLASFGISDAERATLAMLYPTVGQTLWRSTMAHLTPWDCNVPYGLPPGSDPPSPPPDEPDPDGGSGPDPDAPDPHDPGPPPPGGDDHPSTPGSGSNPDPDPDTDCGSIIDCNNGQLGELVPVTGTPYQLAYRSGRTPGANLQSTLRVRVPITGSRIPAGVRRVVAHVEFGGASRDLTLNPPVTNYIASFDWNEQDSYNRNWQGPLRATVTVGYVYQAQYFRSLAERDRSFASLSGYPMSGSLSSDVVEITVYNRWTSAASVSGRPLLTGFWDARGLGIGGWSISDHHVFDPVSRTIYYGDGRFRKVGSIAANDIAGVEPYTEADFSSGLADVLGPDGSIYHLRQGDGEGGYREVVYRLRPGRLVPEVLAQNCPPRPSYDGACASGATPLWRQSRRLLIDERGSLTLLTNSGIFRLNAPSFVPVLSFDPLAFDQPCTIQRGSWQFDQRIYFVCESTDDYTSRIYMLWPNGAVSLMAGGGIRTDSGAPAADTAIGAIGQIAIAPSGEIYFTEVSTSRIRRLGNEGIITTVAGTGTPGFAVDGRMAATSPIDTPTALTVSRDGLVFFADSGRIRQINRAGQLQTLLGGGTDSLNPRGTNIGRRVAIYTSYLAVLPDGSLLFDGGSGLLRWNLSSFRFDAEGANFRFPSEDGREVYVFDSLGRHLQTLNALTGAAKRSFSYNGAGYLTAITDGDHNTTLIARDGGNTALSITSPYGQTTNLQPGTNSLLSRITAPSGQQWQMTYKPGFTGLLESFTAPNNQASTITWDLTGRLLRDTNAEGGFKELSYTQWAAQMASTGGVTSGMGRASTHFIHQYPGGARYKNTQRPNGTTIDSVMTSAYVESQDHSGILQTTRRYDPEPRFGLNAPIVAISDTKLPDPSLMVPGLRRHTTFSRDIQPTVPNADFGQLNLDETVTVNGLATRRYYDAVQRRWTFTSPEGRARTLTLDAQARPTTINVPGLAAIDYTYDARGRLSSVASGSGVDRREWQYGYDTHGYLNSIQDPLLRSVTLTNDAAGRPTAQVLPDTRTIALGYDANNNIISITPPGRNAHQFSYNRVDRVTGYQPPLLGSTATNTGYVNNTDSQLDHSDDADGRRSAIGYVAGSMLPQTLTTPEGTRTFNYVGGQRVGGILTTSDVNTNFTWNGPLPATQTWSGEVAGSVSYDYDNTMGYSHFWLSSIGVNGTVMGSLPSHTDYRYDNDGLMTRATWVPYSGSSVVLDLTRNLSNGLLTGTALGSVTDTWGYNAFAEPTDYSATAAGTAVYSANHVRDKLGRITQTTETIGGVSHVIAYGYDLAGRLHTVTRDGIQTANYEYDSNSNRASLTTPSGTKSGTYDAQDRMTAYGGDTYTYNNSGQLTGRTTTATGAHTTYQYDTLGNLRHVTLPNGTNIDYVIDAMNRRVGKKVNGTLVQGFLYLNQLKPVAELDGSGNVVSAFVYAERSNSPSYMIRGGHTYRVVADHLGSPRLVVDVGDGSVEQRMDYDEFGNVLTDTNPGFQPFGFAGGLYDRDINLVRFGGRDYDPITGRWAAKDSALFAGKQLNFYIYSKNNSINYRDPTGFDAIYINYDYYPVDTNLGFHAPLGHGGMISVNPENGETRYYEFGRYNHNADGEVHRRFVPNVEIGDDGVPAQRSLDKLYDFLSKNYGKDSHVSPEYFPDTDFEAANGFAEHFMRNHPPYDLWNNNCKTFGMSAATACKEGAKTCPYK